ncbi:hypothetical protein [Undibacterium sp.]|uniref:hypothetical protein n=1 Tax=Undibacterium sp. TaxID=1914977 RepID=UPI003752DB91
MVTTAKKKASAAPKAPVVPAKTIADAAAQVVAIRTAEEVEVPVAAVKSKPATKPANKPAIKIESKPAGKVAAKAPAKPAAKAATNKVATKAVSKSAVKVAAKAATASKPAAKKPVAVSKPVVNVAPAKDKVKKPKLVRDSFTMPEAEYAVLSEVKKACIAAGIEVKKSQLLRVGLVLLKKTPISALKTLVEELPPLKAGRPKLG